MAVYGYVRVSTERQAQEGESLDAQERALRGYAMQHGLELASIFTERGVSGSKPLADRPHGAALLNLLRPGDIIITPKLDRMFRSALDALDVLARLKDRGVSLHMLDLGGDVTGNGISKLVFTILSAVAEDERDRIKERIRDVKRDQRHRNRYLGGTAPFGWRKVEERDAAGRITGARLEAIPREQEALRRMKELRETGKSLRQIELEMRRGGFAVSHVTIGRALKELGAEEEAV